MASTRTLQTTSRPRVSDKLGRLASCPHAVVRAVNRARTAGSARRDRLKAPPGAPAPRRGPQSWNRYSYVLGNPLKFIAPLGLKEINACTGSTEGSIRCTGDVDAGNNQDPSRDDERSMDQALFLNFLFGNHAGGGASGRFHHQMRSELGLSVREYANYVSTQGGAGDCLDFTCRVLAEVAEDTLTGTTYLEAGVVAVTEVWLFSGAGVFSLAGETTGSFRLFGATHDGLRFWSSSRSAGGGVHLLSGGKSAGGLDWHRFKLMGRMVNRPHYHRGPNPSQLSKHRPWQGGW